MMSASGIVLLSPGLSTPGNPEHFDSAANSPCSRCLRKQRGQRIIAA